MVVFFSFSLSGSVIKTTLISLNQINYIHYLPKATCVSCHSGASERDQPRREGASPLADANRDLLRVSSRHRGQARSHLKVLDLGYYQGCLRGSGLPSYLTQHQHLNTLSSVPCASLLRSLLYHYEALSHIDLAIRTSDHGLLLYGPRPVGIDRAGRAQQRARVVIGLLGHAR
jgi:hypothetical protein